MDYRDKIISAVAKRGCTRVAGRVVQLLQRTTEGMQSGEGSVLANLWDEVCIQVQGEESIFWDVYLEVIEQYIAQEIRLLDEVAMHAIWLQTSNGFDWAFDQEGDVECVPCDRRDIVNHILNEYILSRAADYSNRRIRKYLEDHCSE